MGVNALVDAIENAIINLELKVGDRLPPQRILAYKLDINPTTVSRAYQRAAEKGLVGGQIGRGTYVLAKSNAVLFCRIMEPYDADVIDLSVNKLLCDDTLLKINQKINDSNLFLAQHQHYEYLSRHLIDYYRLTTSQWMSQSRHIDYQPEQILPLPSCQYGINFLFRHILKRGDVVLVEQYTAPGIMSAALERGLRLFTCKCDEQGLIPSALASMVKQTNANVVITIPSNQSPMATIQSVERRKALAQVIIAQQLLVIEEDIYGMFSEEPPLARYAPDNTLLLSGFSKCLSGGHKAAFLASKHPLLERLKEHIVETLWLVSASAICHIITAIEKGYLEQAIKHVIQNNRKKNQRISRIMKLALSETSPHHWIPSSDSFINSAKQAGILLAHSKNFSVDSGTDSQVYYRLSVHSVSEEQVEKAAIVLAGLLSR